MRQVHRCVLVENLIVGVVLLAGSVRRIGSVRMLSAARADRHRRLIDLSGNVQFVEHLHYCVSARADDATAFDDDL